MTPSSPRSVRRGTCNGRGPTLPRPEALLLRAELRRELLANVLRLEDRSNLEHIALFYLV
jgi:hypothetical protein